MTTFFSWMIYVTNIISMLATIIFFVGAITNNSKISGKETFANCNSQIKLCRIASLVFVVLYWFIVSGMTKEECLEGYSKLSSICSVFGCIWVIFFIINIIVSIILALSKKGRDSMATLGKMRKSNIIMGVLFLVVAFSLKVN